MTFGPTRNTGVTAPQQGLLTHQPNARDVIVNYVNANAARITSIQSTDLDIDIKAGNQGVGVSGSLYCQKPRNFRMRAKGPVGVKDVADLGSNDREFWFYNSEDRPQVLYHCSYDAFARGGVQFPIPFQPEWVLEVLGMAALNPDGNFQVSRVDPGGRTPTFDLIERTTSAQGQPVTKVTVFNNQNVGGTTPQVVAHRLYDARNQLVCEAAVKTVYRYRTANDPNATVTVPHDLELRWPAQQLTLKLKLDGFKINNPEIDVARNPRLFSRPTGYESYDLARGLPQQGPAGLQRTRGLGR